MAQLLASPDLTGAEQDAVRVLMSGWRELVELDRIPSGEVGRETVFWDGSNENGADLLRDYCDLSSSIAGVTSVTPAYQKRMRRALSTYANGESLSVGRLVDGLLDEDDRLVLGRFYKVNGAGGPRGRLAGIFNDMLRHYRIVEADGVTVTEGFRPMRESAE